MKNLLLLFCLPVLLGIGCSKKSTPVIQVQPGIVAKINGKEITDEDIRKVMGPEFVRAEMELYDVKKAGLDQIIQDQVLQEESKKQGISQEELLQKNVDSQIKVTDKEVEKFYNDNKGRFGEKKFDELKGNIQFMLSRQKRGEVLDQYVAKLRKGLDIQVLIQATKLEVPEGDSPAIGPDKAPVHMVEFTDYQCPFCGKARETVNQVLSDYKGKVKYVIRDFPLSFHRDSFKAHEAAHCAGDQGKYWEMNKKLFASQKDLKVEDLKKYASEISLNKSKFEECLNSNKFAERVRQGLEDGQKVGVSGTPAFFINGRMISGARPFPDFKEIIDDELTAN